MNIGADRVGAAGAQPVDEGPGRLAGEAPALPRRTDHPGDLGRPAVAVCHDRGLHRADRGVIGPLWHDPVQPDLLGVARPGGQCAYRERRSSASAGFRR